MATTWREPNPQIAGVLNATQTAHAYEQAAAIAAAATPKTITDDQFVFFAAFDGTRNDKGDVARGGNLEDTNVAQLFKQAHKVQNDNLEGNLRTEYYAGHGTEGSLVASAWLPFMVTQESINTATEAYGDFSEQASDWLKDHPDGEVTTAITAFSRGGATAAVFTHMLYQHGLINPKTGEQLIPAGQVDVSAGVIFDPVSTGVHGNMAFAPNVENVAVIRAEHEYRYLFKGIDYQHQTGLNILPAIGNHSNIGGGYQQDGLGDLYLDAATQYLQKSGLNIANVDIDRRIAANLPLVVYNESGLTKEQEDRQFMSNQQQGQWDVYGYFSSNAETQQPRFLNKAAQPAQTTSSAEGTTTKFLLFNNAHAIEVTPENADKARVYIEEPPQAAIEKHPDLYNLLSLKADLLNDIADRPLVSQQVIINEFDKVMVANIEQGKLPQMSNTTQVRTDDVELSA
jgi:hypothetical protein